MRESIGGFNVDLMERKGGGGKKKRRQRAKSSDLVGWQEKAEEDIDP